ncbi:hypothetical protein EIP86_002447 [Pleurotus ostreatoroseus]|nr:hypothetical protein EIP86_002447 [Pleurotus ostreatoroseus]
MSYLRGTQLLYMMHTCRALYAAGAPYLLQSPVVLRSRARILSFCRYILIEPSRFDLLRSLEIRAPGRFETGPKADLFLAMLTHAKRLEELKILDTEILMSHERIASSLAALTSLRSIIFPALNEAACKVLHYSRSSLEKVEISFWSDETLCPGDPVPLLSRFAHSLCELRVTYAEFLCHDIQYPKVDTLFVDDCRFALAQPIVACFPNVRDLSLWTGQEDEDLEEEEIEEHRQANIQAQKIVRWNCIQHLRGDIRSLYLLGLVCQVEHLDVHSAFLTASRADQLSSLLSEGQPFALSIRIRVSEVNSTAIHRALCSNKDSLARLTIYVDYSDETAPGDWDSAGQCIDFLGSILDHSSITHLVVHFSSRDPEVDPLGLLDLNRLAEVAVQHGPLVQYIILMDRNDEPARFWEVTSEPRTLLMLDTAEVLTRLQ